MDTTLRHSWALLSGTILNGLETLMQAAEQNPELADLRPDVLGAEITLTFRGVPTTLTVRPGMKFTYKDDLPVGVPEPVPAEPEPAPAGAPEGGVSPAPVPVEPDPAGA